MKDGLLFDWPTRHHVHIALPIFLCLSFVVHGVGIVLFQITYPRPKGTTPRSAEVLFLRPGSPEATVIEPLLEASDPALFSPVESLGQNGWNLPKTVYTTSFDQRETSLEAPPEAIKGADTLGLRLLDLLESSSQPAPAPQPGVPTKVAVTGDLAARAFTAPEGTVFTVPARQNLVPAEFLVAAQPDGAVTYVFQLSSSKSESLDQQAANYLKKGRFAPAPAASGNAAWGTVSILWGADVERTAEP